MTEWYNYSTEERIEKVYRRFTLSDFWNWWCGGENKVMEIRIKDYNLIKSLAENYNLPYSASGVYVWTEEMLRLVVSQIKNKATVWWGVNPRKKNYNKWGNKSFGGSDCNIQEIGFIFIDIDRIIKTGPATNIDLGNCDTVANAVIERLQTQGWNKNYIKICSGNGVQLLIKLDFPLKMPEIEFNSQYKTYIESKDYIKLKDIIREGIGKDIRRFCRKYEKELQVEIDKSGFNIGRVAALPSTKNFKYDGFTWRGIVELQNGVNEGFSDYVLSKEDDVVVYESKAVFSKKSLNSRDRLVPGKLKNNILVKFMLEHELPYGMINNYLWFMLKILLRDSKIDLHSEEFQKIHKQIESKVKGHLPMNLPDERFSFDENIVNKYCITNLIPPLYPLWSKRNKLIDVGINDVTWEQIDLQNGVIKLMEDSDIIEDLQQLKKQLIPGYINGDLFRQFVKGCIIKYGEEKTKYYFDYIMKKYLSYE
jgi:hypothetical protein